MDVRKWLQKWLGESSVRLQPLPALTDKARPTLPPLWQHPAVESFAIQALYDRYGAQIYARSAADPAFAAAVAATAERSCSELLTEPDGAGRTR